MSNCYFIEERETDHRRSSEKTAEKIRGRPVAQAGTEVIEEMLMRNYSRTTVRTTALLAFIMIGAASIADAQVSFNIRVGPPPPPPVVRVYQPPRPAPGYVWVRGYWYPVGNNYRWRNGYWARPPYAARLGSLPGTPAAASITATGKAGEGAMMIEAIGTIGTNRYDGHDREHR